MNEIISSLPSTLIGWVAVIILLIAGAVALYGLWDKKVKERQRDVDGSEDRLIDILKETVDQLEIKVDKQTKDIEMLTRQVQELTSERKTLLDILQGRDDQTQTFYKQANDSMAVVHETHDVVTTLATSIQNTNVNMAKLIDLLGKHLEVLDRAGTSK